jgi:manganese/zinc/iron transport system substrate-binding protein
MFLLKKVCLNLFLPLLIAFSALGLTGCSSKGRLNDWMGMDGKKKILSTTAQIGGLAAAIGGDRVDGWVLIQGDLDPHSYEIVKGDGEKVERADLVFYNGLGLEHGASLAALLKSSAKAIPIGEKIAAAEPGRILKRGSTTDPHIWMDISLWKGAVGPIVENLSRIDPEGASYYEERGAALAAEMDLAHNELRSRLLKISPEKRYLVTSHDAFQYFTRSYLADEQEANWKERFAAPEGLAPDGQLNPLDIQRIIDFVKAKRIEVIFPESNVSRDSIKKIAHASRELGIELRVCAEPLYGDSMSGLAYLEMMSRNADVILRHLELSEPPQ